MGVVSKPGDRNTSRTHSRQREPRSRFRIQEGDRLQRLDAPPRHLPGTELQVGQIQCRPVCSTAQCAVVPVFQLSSGPTGIEPAYAFPPFILLGRVLQKIRREKIHQVTGWHWYGQTNIRYPLLLESASDRPISLPQFPDLLTDLAGETLMLETVG